MSITIPSFDLTHLTNEDGSTHPDAKVFFDQLINVLQQNINSEGLRPPQQPTPIILQLNTMKSAGSIIYDSKAGTFTGNAGGTFKTFNMT